MRKKIALMLLTVMTLTMVACGNKDDAGTNDGSSSSQPGVEQSSSEEPSGSEAENQEGTGDVAAAGSALEIIETIWASYEDENKFPVGGGDSSNMTMDVPGAFDATNSVELDAMLGFPAAHVDKIDDAASLMHMMNANTFTSGVYHVTDAANVQTIADALKENIMNRQWMCGFPDTLIIVSFDGNYVLSAFGNGEAIEMFKNKATAAFENATVLYEESLAF